MILICLSHFESDCHLQHFLEFGDIATVLHGAYSDPERSVRVNLKATFLSNEIQIAVSPPVLYATFRNV